MSRPLTIVMAQTNPVVGDIQGNLDQMLDAAARARRAHGAGLVLFPEFGLSGYPIEDLLLNEGFRQQLLSAEAQLREKLPDDIAIAYGVPDWQGEDCFNAAVFLHQGQELARYHKRALPNYGVFDEQRWFTPGDTPCVVDFAGHRLGLTICEDLWVTGPAAETAAAGAELILSLSASPYALGKAGERQVEFGRRVQEANLPVLVCNLLGGQDELVFDGASVGLNADGAVAIQAAEWQDGLYPVDFQEGRLCNGDDAGILDDDAAQYQGAVLATRDYLKKNGADSVLIGLSGGIDSALTLAIAVDAMGAEAVTAVMMGSAYTREISFELAREQAELLGVRYLELPIDESVAAVSASLETGLQGPVTGVAAENLQARLRGVKLMALSNQLGAMVLATGNKSELAVGYATLYGDMVGAFAPIRDLSKTRVYAVSQWRNRQSLAIPEGVIKRPPSAELKPDQYDSDSLPDYDRLDAIIEAVVEQDLGLASLVAAGFDADECARVMAMIQRNEYKRRQGAPGPRLSRRAFGRDRRYPITSGFRQR